MKYAAVIEYSQDKAKVEPHRPAHRAYLTSLVEKNQLFASGPFEDGYGALSSTRPIRRKGLRR